jgi:hypothetical protein
MGGLAEAGISHREEVKLCPEGQGPSTGPRVLSKSKGSRGAQVKGGKGEMRDKRGLWVFLLIMSWIGLLCHSAIAETEKVPKVGPVKINSHPASLEGKTVLLRWNGKLNGDKYLIRFGELLTQQVKNVKIVKLWEVDKSTSAISKDGQASEQVALTTVKLKPDIVIAAQAD